MSIQRRNLTERYANIVINDGRVYLAGVIPSNWNGSIKEQALQVFSNIDTLLAEAGTDKSHMLSMMCFISNFDDFDEFNAAYDSWIDADNLPTRATVQSVLVDKRIKLGLVVVAAQTE